MKKKDKTYVNKKKEEKIVKYLLFLLNSLFLIIQLNSYFLNFK